RCLPRSPATDPRGCPIQTAQRAFPTSRNDPRRLHHPERVPQKAGGRRERAMPLPLEPAAACANHRASDLSSPCDRSEKDRRGPNSPRIPEERRRQTQAPGLAETPVSLLESSTKHMRLEHGVRKVNPRGIDSLQQSRSRAGRQKVTLCDTVLIDPGLPELEEVLQFHDFPIDPGDFRDRDNFANTTLH